MFFLSEYKWNDKQVWIYFEVVQPHEDRHRFRYTTHYYGARSCRLAPIILMYMCALHALVSISRG